MPSSALVGTETVIIAVLFMVLVLGFAVARLRRTRPDFNVAIPVTFAVAIRLWAAAGIASTGLASVLRGGDEITYMDYAGYLASTPWGLGFLPHGPYQLQTVVFAVQLKLAGFTQGALRVTQIGIALLGVVLIVAAVYDLAGGRAARLAAWLLALEPVSIFFDSGLLKEPVMTLASGFVVYGGTKLWRRLDLYGVLWCAIGGLIAVETRSYAGWFLVSASVLLALHAAIRQVGRSLAAMPLIYVVAIIAFVAVPVVVQASSNKSLATLQASQNANASGAGETAGAGGANGDNLALESVNFSTRSAILTNLPKRIRDVLLKPYPWQLGDTSQRVGALGTLVAYAALLAFVLYAWRSRGSVFPRSAPLLYPLFFLTIAYSLSAGNAGTAFRYRAHLVTLLLTAVAVLREHALLAPRASRSRRFGRRALAARAGGWPAAAGAGGELIARHGHEVDTAVQSRRVDARGA